MLKKLAFCILYPRKAFCILFESKFQLPVEKWIVNVFFQRFLQINSDTKWQVHFTSTVIAPSKITIGKNVWKSFALSGNCYIQGGNGIYIDDDTKFAPGVKIISANHDVNNDMKWITAEPVRIGKRCWIGTNAVILPEVTLGDNCIVGAGAVVTKSFPYGSIIVGVPGQWIKSIKRSNTNSV